MYQKGHVGASLAAYAPFGFVVTALASIELGAVGAVAVASTAMLPDLDTRVPFVKHRGITHTVWFGIAVGLGFGTVGALAGVQEGPVATLLFGALGFGFGVFTVISHLLADAVTPMGIEPFAPLRDDHFTLDLVRAANPAANYALLVFGVAVVGVAFVAGEAVPV